MFLTNSPQDADDAQRSPDLNDSRATPARRAQAPHAAEEMFRHLTEIVGKRLLTAIFQPIVAMKQGSIVGYEGLIRGPSNSPLHSPLNLFKAADHYHLSLEVEQLCRQVVLETFAGLRLPGKLFLNVSPECLLQPRFKPGVTLAQMHTLGLSPEQVIIELTENQPTYDYELLREAAVHYRSMGFQIAIDDLGEGFSSLRLWSELRPDYVKIDMHFVQGINQDPVKLHFVRSIQQMAESSDCLVIAEGIETQAELMIVKDLGIAFGQGYFIGRPNAVPVVALPARIDKALNARGIFVYPLAGSPAQKTVCATRLLIEAPTVTPATPTDELYRLFAERPELHAIPVVQDGAPVGLVNRHKLIDFFSRLYSRELFGKKPCIRMMDPSPLVVDRNISIQDLSNLVVAGEQRHLADGFIITEKGQYAGIGTGHDLMREITELQINAARYANPLTLLPGNVPISEHIDRLLEGRAKFVAAYCDLDNFKPFNDRHGYRRGDDLIQVTGKILAQACDPERDFIGHIGGDDFIVLFQSRNWETRCRRVLRDFDAAAAGFFSKADIEAGGYTTGDRQGQQIFHPLTRLSIGCVRIEPGAFASHHQISAAAAVAKTQAKRLPGSSLFVDRRAAGSETGAEKP